MSLWRKVLEISSGESGYFMSLCPYAQSNLRDLLSGSSMRLYRSLTFEESIDIFSLVTPSSQESIDILHLFLLRCPPLWTLIDLPLPVFLQVPGSPFEYFLQDEPLAEHYLRCWF